MRVVVTTMETLSQGGLRVAGLRSPATRPLLPLGSQLDHGIWCSAATLLLLVNVCVRSRGPALSRGLKVVGAVYTHLTFVAHL
jgi:hypothetical protein